PVGFRPAFFLFPPQVGIASASCFGFPIRFILIGRTLSNRSSSVNRKNRKKPETAGSVEPVGRAAHRRKRPSTWPKRAGGRAVGGRGIHVDCHPQAVHGRGRPAPQDPQTCGHTTGGNG